MLKWPLPQNSMKMSVMKLNLSAMINQLNFKRCLTASNNVRKQLKGTEFWFLHYLTLKYWGKFFTRMTFYIFQGQICNWVWKQCNDLQVNCNLLSQYWSKFSMLYYLQKYRTENTPLGNITIYVLWIFQCNFHDFTHLENSFLLWKFFWTI